MNLKELTKVQRLGWYGASLVYGLCVLAIGVKSGYLYNENISTVAASVFFIAWLAGVMGLRLHIQNVDPTDFKSILGVKK